MTKDYSSLINGLKRLRTGSLLQIISVVLGIIAVVYFFIAVGASIMTMSPQLITLAMLSSLMGTLVIGLISGILLLVGFIYWFIATDHLKKYSDRLSIGKTGVVLVIAGIIIVILSVLSLIGVMMAHLVGGHSAIGLAIIGGVLLIVGLGSILVFIGWILFSVMLMRLGDLDEVSNSIHTAGVLYLIGIILSVIPYVGFIGNILLLVAIIMIYSGSGNTIDKLQTKI